MPKIPNSDYRTITPPRNLINLQAPGMPNARDISHSRRSGFGFSHERSGAEREKSAEQDLERDHGVSNRFAGRKLLVVAS